MEHESDLRNNPYKKPKVPPVVEGDSDLFAYTHEYEVLEPFKGILYGVKGIPEETHDEPRN